MFIDSIILNNFRAYKGVNQTSFQKNGKNLVVNLLEPQRAFRG